MRLFGSERVMGMMENLGVDEDTPIEQKMLSNAIETAQKKVESKNFQQRKMCIRDRLGGGQAGDHAPLGQHRLVLEAQHGKGGLLGQPGPQGGSRRLPGRAGGRPVGVRQGVGVGVPVLPVVQRLSLIHICQHS